MGQHENENERTSTHVTYEQRIEQLCAQYKACQLTREQLQHAMVDARKLRSLGRCDRNDFAAMKALARR